jgi:hypothetical protein
MELDTKKIIILFIVSSGLGALRAEVRIPRYNKHGLDNYNNSVTTRSRTYKTRHTNTENKGMA